MLAYASRRADSVGSAGSVCAVGPRIWQDGRVRRALVGSVGPVGPRVGWDRCIGWSGSPGRSWGTPGGFCWFSGAGACGWPEDPGVLAWPACVASSVGSADRLVRQDRWIPHAWRPCGLSGSGACGWSGDARGPAHPAGVAGCVWFGGPTGAVGPSHSAGPAGGARPAGPARTAAPGACPAGLCVPLVRRASAGGADRGIRLVGHIWWDLRPPGPPGPPSPPVPPSPATGSAWPAEPHQPDRAHQLYLPHRLHLPPEPHHPDRTHRLRPADGDLPNPTSPIEPTAPLDQLHRPPDPPTPPTPPTPTPPRVNPPITLPG